MWASYIDAEKTLAKGRKIGKERAVVRPRLGEMAEAVKRLGLVAAMEVRIACVVACCAYEKASICVLVVVCVSVCGFW